MTNTNHQLVNYNDNYGEWPIYEFYQCVFCLWVYQQYCIAIINKKILEMRELIDLSNSKYEEAISSVKNNEVKIQINITHERCLAIKNTGTRCRQRGKENQSGGEIINGYCSYHSKQRF